MVSLSRMVIYGPILGAGLFLLAESLAQGAEAASRQREAEAFQQQQQELYELYHPEDYTPPDEPNKWEWDWDFPDIGWVF